jgi:hypothetical protein
MSEIDKYNNARQWWERKKKELNKSIDEMLSSECDDKETIEAMKIILNNNIKIKRKEV